MNPFEIMRRMMASKQLAQAGGVGQAQPQPQAPSTDPTYLQQQVAMNPNNVQPAQFETPLTPQEEAQFQIWKAQNAPRDSGADYDLRGAFKAGLSPAANGHWPDTYKKPNHPTFSNESIYATPDAPSWRGPNGGNILVSNRGQILYDETMQPSNKLKAGKKTK